jgi:hypothetical protein
MKVIYVLKKNSKMNKIKAFFDAAGAFLRWMWKYPTTPIENFQDARFRYSAQLDPEIIKAFDDIQKSIEEHQSSNKKN